MDYLIKSIFALAALFVGGGIVILGLVAAYFVQILDRTLGGIRVNRASAAVDRSSGLEPAHLDPADEMPDSLAQWIARESEPWAREELQAQAYLMRRSGYSWESIQRTFSQVHGRATADPEAAADAAWDAAGKHLST